MCPLGATHGLETLTDSYCLIATPILHVQKLPILIWLVQSRIAELEAQVERLSSQSADTDEERSSFLRHISTLTETLAIRNQQLMDAHTQLVHVRIMLITKQSLCALESMRQHA